MRSLITIGFLLALAGFVICSATFGFVQTVTMMVAVPAIVLVILAAVFGI